MIKINSKLIFIILLFSVLLSIANAESDRFLQEQYDYQYILFDFIDDYNVKQSATFSVTQNPDLNCALVYAQSFKSGEFFRNINPSDLTIRINNKEVNYVNPPTFLKAWSVTDKLYTIFNSCEDDIVGNEDLDKQLKDYCRRELISDKALYIRTNSTSAFCNYDVIIKSHDVSNNIKGNFLEKNFSTPFYIFGKSDPFEIEIILPPNNIIIINNLEEYVISKTDNQIKWSIKNNANLSKENFWVVYKKSYLQWIVDLIIESNLMKILLTIITLSGLGTIIYGIIKFIIFIINILSTFRGR